MCGFLVTAVLYLASRTGWLCSFPEEGGTHSRFRKAVVHLQLCGLRLEALVLCFLTLVQPSVYFLSKLANRALLTLTLAISLLHLSTSLFLCHHSHPFLLAQDFLILPLDYSLFSTPPLSVVGQVHFLCLPIIFAGCERRICYSCIALPGL